MGDLRVVLCDDELLAVQRLRRLLTSCGGFNIVAAETSGEEAAQRIIDLSPDVVFLDIEMPSPDGFEIVELICRATLGQRRPPFVVFVTAHSEFAPQAFDTGAIDFLTKPVRQARLEACLGRAREAVAGRSAADQLAQLQRSFELLLRERPAVPSEREHVWIHRRGELVRLDMDDVTVIRAEAEYVRLFSNEVSYLHRGSIGAIESSLDPKQFIRIHRSTIVRRSQVVALKRSLHGGIVVRLTGGDEYAVGRKYAKLARTALTGKSSEVGTLHGFAIEA